MTEIDLKITAVGEVRDDLIRQVDDAKTRTEPPTIRKRRQISLSIDSWHPTTNTRSTYHDTGFYYSQAIPNNSRVEINRS